MVTCILLGRLVEQHTTPMLLGDIKYTLLLAFYEDFLAQIMTPIRIQFTKICLALQSFYLKLNLYV